MFKNTTGQRSRRRTGTRWVAALAGLGMAAGMGWAASPSEAAPNEVAPGETAPSESATSDAIRAGNLPWESDLEWHEAGDWKATDLYAGEEGEERTTKCLRGPVVHELNVDRMYQRDYEYPDAEKNRASALILEFETNKVADRAYSELATWATECAATLDDQGYTQFGPARGHLISIPGTEARFTELSYRHASDNGDEAFFESIGAVRDGNKVALVSMTSWGMDNNWSYDENDESDLPLHPMYRSMPKVAERLVR